MLRLFCGPFIFYKSSLIKACRVNWNELPKISHNFFFDGLGNFGKTTYINTVKGLIPLGILAYFGWRFFEGKAQDVSEQVKYNIVKVGIDKRNTNLSKLTIVAVFRMTNPTTSPIKIISIIGDLSAGGQDFTFSMLTPTEINPLSKKDLRISIEIPALTGGQMVGKIITAIRTGKSVFAKLDGFINFPVGRLHFVETKKLI